MIRTDEGSTVRGESTQQGKARYCWKRAEREQTREKSYGGVMRKIVINKTITNLLLLCIVFAIFLGILLYSISKCLMLVGLDSRYSIVVGGCISMMIMMVALKLTGIKMGVVEK